LKRTPSTDLVRRVAALSPEKQALLALHLDRSVSTGHELVARSLRARDVTTVYGVPGVPVYGTFGACARAGMRTIGARHQQGATLMAAAHNYVAGSAKAVTVVSSGAAASNAVSGVTVARDNGWPLVLLAGAVPRNPPGFGYFTDLDLVPLFHPITKAAVTVNSVGDIPATLNHALSESMRGRPGPVFVQLPADVLEASGILRDCIDPSDAALAIDGTSLDEAVRMLTDAARPLLILGKGARWKDAYDDVRRLVDLVDLPFVTSPMARGYLPDDHRHCFNEIRWAAQREADAVLLLGARLDWTFRHGTQIASHAGLIHVDVNREELGRNRPAQLPIHGDIGRFAQGVLERFAAHGRRRVRARRDMAWVASLEARRWSAELARHQRSIGDGSSIAPEELGRVLAGVLPRNAITVLDGNLVLRACERHMLVRDPVCRMTPGTPGCLGVGIPYAIGAKLAHPERPVVAVCGDFAFGLTGFEMETAVRHRVPIVVIIANNDGNAGVMGERQMFPDGHAERVSMFMPQLRYSDMMSMFGGHAEHVDRGDALAPAVSRALTAGKPACINVRIDPYAAFPSE